MSYILLEVIVISVTKNQHYVSRGILKQFCDEQKKIYEVYIEKKIVSKKHIDNTMAQNYVYEHPDLKENMIEDLFAGFESKAFPLFDTLIEDIEQNYKDEKFVEMLITKLNNLIPYVLLFYFRSGALLKEYSMDTNNPKITRVERMLLNILDVKYVRGLRNTIVQHYNCGFIVDEKERFLLSDQYVSTVALKYKNRFSNASNRQIGMRETMILVPLSAKFYAVFYNGKAPQYIRENSFSILTDSEVEEINDVIYQNSYIKCVGKSSIEINRVMATQVTTLSPTKCILKYSDGTIQDRIIKREVFLYPEDRDMNAHSFEYMSTYVKDIKDKIGRNDRCICGSGKKYKKCCMEKYERAAQILFAVNNQGAINYTIPGVTVIEDSILEYQGVEDGNPNIHDKQILSQLENMINGRDKNNEQKI